MWFSYTYRDHYRPIQIRLQLAIRCSPSYTDERCIDVLDTDASYSIRTTNIGYTESTIDDFKKSNERSISSLTTNPWQKGCFYFEWISRTRLLGVSHQYRHLNTYLLIKLFIIMSALLSLTTLIRPNYVKLIIKWCNNIYLNFLPWCDIIWHWRNIYITHCSSVSVLLHKPLNTFLIRMHIVTV